MSNQYYICQGRHQEPISWNPWEDKLTAKTDKLECAAYLSQVFAAMDKQLETTGLIFYITRDVHHLPSYGKNVVAILLGDEWSRIPTYFHKVLAVFKWYGSQPMLGCNPLLQPSYLNVLTLIQYLRILVVCLPSSLNYRFQQLKSWVSGINKLPPVYPLPLGYNTQVELPIKDIEARLTDIFFSGSVVHMPLSKWSLKKWLRTPKTISRREMISNLNQFKEKHPDINVDLSVTPGYHYTVTYDVTSFSERMMNAKICLVPRGTAFETTRFFEAIRYGCILVTEVLPPWWFYEGSPAIQVKNWQELGGILETLLVNPQLRQEKHQEALDWWQSKCSEIAVGTHIAAQLNALRML
jgi:hypothetical protein